MTCSLPDGVEIKFPRSGVRVRPYEGDVKIQKRNYAEAEFVLSEKAGEVIASNVENREPAILTLGGDDVYRLVRLDDSVEFQKNFDRENEAILTLHDARRVLDSSAISKRWNNAELETVVSFILESSDDPHNVISEVDYVSGSDPSEGIESIGDIVPDISIFPWQNTIYLDDGSLVIGEEGIEFDDITPLAALQKLTDALEYSFWVDIDGTLKVGLDETWGQAIYVDGQTSFSVERLDILEPQSKVATIVAKAPQQSESGDWFPDPVLRSVAEANAPEIDGGTLAIGTKKGATLEAIKKVAERRLIKEISDDINGSGVFNGLASENQEALGKLTVGDHFIISDSAFNSCRTSPAGGHYIVNNVHHRINPRQGWRVDVDFARIPETIETTSFYYDPQDDKRYETLSAYQPGRGRPAPTDRLV